MYLKNIGARLITINTPKPQEKSYQVIPAGDAVEVPDNGINAIVKAFIDGFIAADELVEVPAPKVEKAAKAKQTEE